MNESRDQKRELRLHELYPVKRPGRMIGATAATAATAALACGVCCVLPIALPAIALTTTGSALAWFGNAHAWVTGVACVMVLAGWFWVGSQSIKFKNRPAAATLWMMSVATLVLAGALAWSRVEPAVVRMITG
jgi:hypothetical protein